MTRLEPSAATRGNSNDHVRRHNLSTMLGLVHRANGMPRSQLTQQMGLNRSTIAALVAELVEHDLLREEGAETTFQVGRPSQTVLPSSTPVAIAVNPEIDAITLGVVGLGGRVLSTQRHPLPAVPSAQEAVEIIAGLVAALMPVLTIEHRVVGIGVAVPGLVRESDGMVRLAPHLQWHDEPLAELLSSATDLPVSVANDAHLGIRAEGAFGEGGNVQNLVYLHGGASGIGGGIIANGLAISGAEGYAGELGHAMVNPFGQACHCGAIGCLETEVRLDRLLEVTGLGSDSLDQLAHRLASSVDPRVAAEVNRQRAFLAVSLRNAINMLNPSMIVLGGFLAELHGADPARLDDLGVNRPLAASHAAVDIRPAKLRSDLLMIGGAELALDSLFADPAAFGAKGTDG